jgi:signal transduction histidine kinase
MLKTKLNQSIRFKFMIIMSFILLAGTVLISLIIATNEGKMLRLSLMSTGQSLVSYIAQISGEPLVINDSTKLDDIVMGATREDDIVYAIICDKEGVLLTSEYASINYNMDSARSILLKFARDHDVKELIDIIKRRESIIEISNPILMGQAMISNQVVGWATIGISTHNIHHTLLRTIVFIIVLNTLLAIVVIIVLYFISNKMVFDPLDKIVDASDRLAKGDLTTEVNIKSTGEIKTLVDSFNSMVRDLEKVTVSLRKSRDELDLRVEQRTAALEKANIELRQIPSKLLAVLEEERRRLASELHDSIGQTLAAIKFRLEMVLKLMVEGDGTAASKHLEQFVPILQRSIEETRCIYMGLRPSMLDTHGLFATLEWQRRECMGLYPDRHIELETGIAEEEIPESLKISIFRIAQESLNNVAKHSSAEWVDISLSKSGDGIELVVSDDGVGMDLDLIMQTRTGRSLGLTGMRERAELTGGKFTIESTLGEGTTIRVFWPIEAEDQHQDSSAIQ